MRLIQPLKQPASPLIVFGVWTNASFWMAAANLYVLKQAGLGKERAKQIATLAFDEASEYATSNGVDVSVVKILIGLKIIAAIFDAALDYVYDQNASLPPDTGAIVFDKIPGELWIDGYAIAAGEYNLDREQDQYGNININDKIQYLIVLDGYKADCKVHTSDDATGMNYGVDFLPGNYVVGDRGLGGNISYIRLRRE